MAPPAIVAGPCSAESEEQLLATANSLRGIPITYFRAGLWKPRTRPGAFQGVGTEGIQWLASVKKESGLRVMTEVSLPRHVEEVLKGGIEAVWLGARTVSDPFAVQDIADALKGNPLPVFIKNPISPDTQLWLGAIERLQEAGITDITAVFRGFSTLHTAKSFHRNTPYWSVAYELKSFLPSLPLFCDPSHITGRRDEIEPMCRTAIEMGFDGLMIECHIAPNEAKSDAAQQITPDTLRGIVERLASCQRLERSQHAQLESFRTILSEIDETLLMVLARRMEVARSIGQYKQEHLIPILQTDQFSTVLRESEERARRLGLDEAFVRRLFSAIHELSISVQTEAIKP